MRSVDDRMGIEWNTKLFQLSRILSVFQNLRKIFRRSGKSREKHKLSFFFYPHRWQQNSSPPKQQRKTQPQRDNGQNGDHASGWLEVRNELIPTWKTRQTRKGRWDERMAAMVWKGAEEAVCCSLTRKWITAKLEFFLGLCYLELTRGRVLWCTGESLD